MGGTARRPSTSGRRKVALDATRRPPDRQRRRRIPSSGSANPRRAAPTSGRRPIGLHSEPERPTTLGKVQVHARGTAHRKDGTSGNRRADVLAVVGWVVFVG